MRLSRHLAVAFMVTLSATNAYSQSLTPFTGCPARAIAVTRTGNNNYQNEPVSFYNISPVTGAGTLIPGGPLKNPQFQALNFDMNAVGLNAADGFLYGINPGLLPRFYRMGSNYAIQQVGVLASPGVNFPLLSFVNPAAGTFDNSGNYYFSGLSAFININPPSLNPFEFYIGKINPTALPAGTGTISPTYTKLNFGNAACGEYLNTLQQAVSPESAQNTGLRDLAFNVTDNKLYTYVTFEYPANSGIFKGQLLSADPVTGTVTCYPSQVLGFANASNEVAGVAIAFTGDLLVLFTGGATYKAVSPATGVYTGGITLLNPASVPSPLRGDLATCGGISAGPTPVTFQSFRANENRCEITYEWVIAQEINVNRYELEVRNAEGVFVNAGNLPAINAVNGYTYSLSIPVDGNLVTARVKAVDNDGRITYSQILQKNTTCSELSRVVLLNSMQVTQTLTARWSNIANNGRYTIRIFNATGKEMLINTAQINRGTSLSTLDIKSLIPGTYFFVAQNETGEKFTIPFVKK
ncbi:T9SS type A sorting domain-containing protein [Ferruginibacter sp. HRS2-29]|uniref:T9SS type A sorting domain-containing protein n=1 Tax=Ferruginibacter sp. HRS2-29 TaxID=2487334 RepID=UPI0020CEF34C|nr:T9SS type A sorting domain-containing protein [Ferruginibacter sp. HRS2-29]